MKQEKAYIKVSKLRMEIEVKKAEVKNLLPKAIKELRSEGFSYDKIVKILDIGKITAIKLTKTKP